MIIPRHSLSSFAPAIVLTLAAATVVFGRIGEYELRGALSLADQTHLTIVNNASGNSQTIPVGDTQNRVIQALAWDEAKREAVLLINGVESVLVMEQAADRFGMPGQRAATVNQSRIAVVSSRTDSDGAHEVDSIAENELRRRKFEAVRRMALKDHVSSNKGQRSVVIGDAAGGPDSDTGTASMPEAHLTSGTGGMSRFISDTPNERPIAVATHVIAGQASTRGDLFVSSPAKATPRLPRTSTGFTAEEKLLNTQNGTVGQRLAD